MINRRFLFPIIVSLIIVTLSSSSQAFFNRDVKKAKEFMAAGMYPQAIELLDKRINEKPTDAEAHFQLGVCYVIIGNYDGADQRFCSAVRLEPEYGYKIGPEYHETGSTALGKGRVGEAQMLFSKAVEYQPDLKAEIGQECFTAGQSYLSRGEVGHGKKLLISAAEYNPKLKKDVAQECFMAAEKFLNQQWSNAADDFLSLALAYDPSLNTDRNRITKDYGKKLLAIAKTKPKEERKKYVDEAKKYLSQKDIDEVLPPPGWKSVKGFPKEFEGKGTNSNEAFIVLTCCEEVKAGEKVIFTGNKFLIGRNKKKIHSGRYAFTYHGTESGLQYRVRVPVGEKITVDVKRYTTSY